MHDPQGQSFGGPDGKDDEAPERLDQCVEQEIAVDRFGPGLDGADFQAEGRGSGVEGGSLDSGFWMLDAGFRSARWGQRAYRGSGGRESFERANQ